MTENKAMFEKNGHQPAGVPDPEVVAKRRRFVLLHQVRLLPRPVLLADSRSLREQGEERPIRSSFSPRR